MGSEADAVRFSVVADDPELRLVYIMERNHSPAEHGNFAYPSGVPDGREILMAQARAFVESYRRRQKTFEATS
jgi:hypothetical protein